MAFNLFTQLDYLAYRFQLKYMKSKKTTEKVSLHSAFFHPRPTDKIILKKYYERIHSRGGVAPAAHLGSVILVTGCFDVLHSEHKKFLHAAKKLGGRLLVGLETDPRVRQLKGKNRPINPLPLRLKNLRQLGIADQVFSLPEKFSSPADYLAFLHQIHPDILAVSASTPNLAAKRRLMRRLHGRVAVVLPFNSKISTSKLLKSH